MKDFLLALVAGVIGGIISPFIVSWLQHFVIWKSQKRLEIKHSIFSDTVRALSMYALGIRVTSPHSAIQKSR